MQKSIIPFIVFRKKIGIWAIFIYAWPFKFGRIHSSGSGVIEAQFKVVDHTLFPKFSAPPKWQNCVSDARTKRLYTGSPNFTVLSKFLCPLPSTSPFFFHLPASGFLPPFFLFLLLFHLLTFPSLLLPTFLFHLFFSLSLSSSFSFRFLPFFSLH